MIIDEIVDETLDEIPNEINNTNTTEESIKKPNDIAPSWTR